MTQFDLFGNAEPRQFKVGKESVFEIDTNNGKISVRAKPLNGEFHVRKEQGRYFLTHTKTGKLLTSARTMKLLMQLVNEPEFFEEPLSIENLKKAYARWLQKNNFSV